MILHLIHAFSNPKVLAGAPQSWRRHAYVYTTHPTGSPGFVMHFAGGLNAGLQEVAVCGAKRQLTRDSCLTEQIPSGEKYLLPYAASGLRGFYLVEDAPGVRETLHPGAFERGFVPDTDPDFVYTKITPAVEQELVAHKVPMILDRGGKLIWRVIPFHTFKEIPEPYKLLGVYPTWRGTATVYEILCLGCETGYMYLTSCSKDGSAAGDREANVHYDAFAAPDILLCGTTDSSAYSLSSVAGVAVTRRDDGVTVYDPEVGVMSEDLRLEMTRSESLCRSRTGAVCRLPCDLRYYETDSTAPDTGAAALRNTRLKHPYTGAGRWMLDPEQTLDDKAYSETSGATVNDTYYQAWWNGLIAPDTDTVLLRPGTPEIVWNRWESGNDRNRPGVARTSPYPVKLPEVRPVRNQESEHPDKTLRPIALLLKGLGIKNILYDDEYIPYAFSACMQAEGLQLWKVQGGFPRLFCPGKLTLHRKMADLEEISDTEFVRKVVSCTGPGSASRLDRIWAVAEAIIARYDLEFVPY